ncbi:DUF2486 family protein [Paraburkholderia sprentiae WSM5005]|uniref:DUF2486 family protein n=1 Tax=Paraburkholderia sprentiae WSM5005 TaxID=754502 RepID=A0A1I9YGV9_9BURK|nr:DUF2486 family protein [Paraburkholderia sprentiae]APA85542.1 DUF2486 family protein [Paraburkholderia sprentiae WSM5005]
MSDPHDNPIPVLNEILVPGRTRETRETSADAAAPAPQPGAEPATPSAAQPAAREPGSRTEPAFAPPPAHQAEPMLAPEPVLAPQPVPTPEQLSSPEPVFAPQPLPSGEAAHAAEHVPLAQTELHEPHVADHTHPRKHARPHHGIHGRHAHDDLHEGVVELSPGAFDRTEPFIPLEAGATVPPDIGREGAHEVAPVRPALDADAIAARLHARFQGFLTGDGRGIIEARCRDAVQQHASLLAGQITREVAQTLEAEMTAWVREAVEEEIARRSH